jgi:ATP-binding cassette subfamily B protein
MLSVAVEPINGALLTKDKPPPAREQSRAVTFLRLVGLLEGRERCWCLLAVLATSVASLLGMALPVYTGKLVSAVSSDNDFDPACQASPEKLAQCRRDSLADTLLIMGLAFFVSGIALALGLWLFFLSGERLAARLRRKLYASYMHKHLGFFDEQKTGDLMNRLASDCTELKDTLTRSLGEGMHNALQMSIGLTLMLLSSPLLTLLTLAAAPIIGVCAGLYGCFISKLTERYQAALGEASDVAQQALSSIRTVRSFAREGFERSQYDAKIERAYALGKRKGAALGAFIGFVSTIAQASLVLVLWFGCTMVIDGKLDFGELTSFVLIAIYTISSFGGLMDLFSAMMGAIGVSRRLFAILDEPSPPLEGGSTLVKVRGQITFRDVHFGYPSRKDVPVLRGVSFHVHPGQALALCGSSGSGKSSIIALLERFYEPSSGDIEVDGVPLASLDPSWWRRQIALVAQEPVLFNGSVLDNLRYGNPEATREAATEAAQVANAHDFILGFTDQYETLVGERGVKLSGGQKQRLAIARAVLLAPAVLLLDEATSALDAEAEAIVQAALDRVMAGRTSIVIAHRLSTIRHADCICVIERGVVIERGTHEELLGTAGAYEKLCRRQMESSVSRVPSGAGLDAI